MRVPFRFNPLLSFRSYRLTVTTVLACLALLATQAVSAQAVTQFPGMTTVGQSSGPITLPVMLTSTASAYAVVAVTEGVENMDFSVTAETCTADEPAPPVGTTCTATVVFTPKYPGLRMGAVLVKSSDGSTLLGSALIAGVGQGSLAVLDPGVINTIAGNQFWTYSPGNEDYPANASSLYLPYGVVVDPSGKMYISDTLNGRVRMVDANGKIWTIAGNGTFGYAGDGGPAASAEVDEPAGLAIDGAGNLYFADSGNDVVRRIDAVSGVITTVAGTPRSAGFGGDGGAATAATLSSPEGIAFDAAGNLYIADTGNDVVREVDATNGTISTVAGEPGQAAYNHDGPATTSMLNMPWAVVVGLDGALYIADTGNSRIRRVIGGVISTVAGSNFQSYGGDGGPAIQAAMNQPYGIALDPAGDLYIADSGNHCIRKVSPGNGVANGTALIQTIIGTTAEGFAGDGKAANKAELNGPYALYFAQNGDFYFADTHNDRIRMVTATQFSLGQFPDTKATKVSSPPQTEGLDSDGNADLNLLAPGLTNAAVDASTTCSFTAATAMGTSCTVAVNFAPATVGSNLQGSVMLNSDAANTPAEIDLTGNGLDVNPTTVTVTSNANPSVTGQTVTLTAMVTNHGAGALSGPVTFEDGGTALCSNVNVNAQGSATCPTTFSTVGTHAITANYAGDANNEANEGTLSETVKQQATVTLTATPQETTVMSNVQLLVTVTGSGTPTGTVTFFYDSTALFGPTTLDGSGRALVVTNAIPAGHHTLSVAYAGDASNAAGTSNIVDEVIDQAATTTTLATSNANPTVGDAVTLTATVTPGEGFSPTGTVVFTDNGTVMPGSPVTLNGSETASLTLSSLTPGHHAIVATYQGDTDNASSYSSALSETVAQIGTVTAVSSDVNPLSAGATLHLTAAVSLAQGATADGAISGQVTFSDGGTALNTVAVDVNGLATLAVSSLTVGTHSITATYSGATNYASSISSALTQQVQKTATVVTLSSSASTVYAGTSLSLTALVTSSTGIPTGSVIFNDGGAVLGTINLNLQASATLTLSTLAAGNHTITATYNGDSNYSAGGSSGLSETVNLAQPVINVSGPAAPVDVGTSVVLTGTLSGPGVTPTGILSLLDGGAVIATQTVSSMGQFRFSIGTLGLGTQSLSVAYGGDSDNAAANSASLPVMIQLAPTATALSSSSNPGMVGQTVTVTASVVSDSAGVTGTVTFMDGASSLGTASLGSSGTASLAIASLGFGAHSITATYSGDAQHATSHTTFSQMMTDPATATLTSSVNPAIAGSDVVLTAAVHPSGGQIPTGSVVFSDGQVVLGTVSLDIAGNAVLHTSSLGVGQHTIAISYAGDPNVASASAALTQTIVSATAQIALSASTALSTYSTPLTLTAAITSNGRPPSGNVLFTDGIATIGSAAVNAQGVAALTIATLSPGTHTIIAQYTGDARTGAAQSSGLNVVVKQTTSLVVTASGDSVLTLTPITLTATLKNEGAGAASGTIVFSDGSATLGSAPLNADGAASLSLPSLSAGSHAISASYAGDGNDFASTSSVLTETVGLRASATALTGSNTDPSNSQEVTLIAVVQGGGPNPPSGTVSFTSGSLQLGSVPVNASGVGTLTILLDQSNSAENIVAQYSGDSVYSSSNSASVAVQAGPATQFTLAIDPASINVAATQHTTITLSLQSVAGFSDTIQLGCLGLPFAATCTFSAPQTKLSANANTNVQLTIDTADPLGMGAQTSAHIRNPGRNIFLCSLPAVLLMGLFRRKRKLAYAWISLACFTLMISGCSGLQGASTPPGTYSFKVTASGQGSGATESQVVTLTVTQ